MPDLEIPTPSVATGGTPPYEPGRLYPVWTADPPPFLNRLKLALTCALLAAVTGLVVQATFLLHAATQATRALPVAISRDLRDGGAGLAAQVAALRQELFSQITLTRQDLLVWTERQVAALRRDAMCQIAAIRTDALTEVGAIRTTADRRMGDTLERVAGALGMVEELRGDLQPVVTHAASFTKQVDDAAPLFLDCEYNPDCFFNRYVGASKSIERAAGNFAQVSLDFRNALPTGIATWQGIGTNVAGITGNINQLTKPRWYDRLLGYGLNGVIIYRNLNPVTSVAVKGAQLIASRP
jgi:hypothetical protein